MAVRNLYTFRKQMKENKNTIKKVNNISSMLKTDTNNKIIEIDVKKNQKLIIKF